MEVRKSSFVVARREGIRLEHFLCNDARANTPRRFTGLCRRLSDPWGADCQ